MTDQLTGTDATASGDRPAADARGETRRRAMLDAACELFLEHGFGGTSVAQVVQRSGGSLATLYALFGSKEGLFEAIVEETTTQIIAPLDAPEFESRPLGEALCLFGERFLSLVLRPTALRWHRMCVAEGEKFPQLRAALVRTGPGHVQERLATYLAAHAAAGRLQVDQPRVAAIHFLSLIKSEAHLAALCGEPIETSPEEIAEQVRRAVEVFLNGYRASSTELDVSPRRPRRRSFRSS